MKLQQARDKFLDRRVIVLDGDITSKDAHEVTGMMFALTQDSTEPITLLINSTGGDLLAGMLIYDAMQTFNLPVTGLVLGQAGSTAVTVLLGCKKRCMTVHSKIFVHNVHSINCRVSVDLDEEKFNEHMSVVRQGLFDSQQTMVALYQKRTGLNYVEVKALLQRGDDYGESLRAPQALNLGFVDEIIDSYPLFEELKRSE